MTAAAEQAQAAAHLAGKNAAQLREQYTNHQTSRPTTKTR